MTQESSRKFTATERLLRLPEVESLVGLRKTAIYAAMKAGTFPAAVKLSRRAVCWPSSAVDAWIADRIKDAAKGGQ